MILARNTRSERRKTDAALWICLLLALVTLAVYWQVHRFEFVNFDDDLYVTDNPYVRSGITRPGLVWAFDFEAKNRTYWHPLTWLSHMLDVELYGLAPGRHHLTNVFFHVASTLLLFLVLVRLTGELWPSAFVAVLFALHPLNVESVAWVSERKNVLSTFFWMLTLAAYAHYVKKPNAGRYLLVAVALALGLLAKPMLVTLPFVLLLLDFWPLRRIGIEACFHNHPDEKNTRRSNRSTCLAVVLEKIPLLVLCGLSVYLSTMSLTRAANVISPASVSMKLRLENLLVSNVKYIWKMIWPQNLAVFYPYPQQIPTWQVAIAALLVGGITVFVFRYRKSHPYLGVGWLWYLGTLMPVSGLVQAGLWPAMADRWAYVPLIGLFIMIAWTMVDLGRRVGYENFILAFTFGLSIVLLVFSTRIQLGYWRSSTALFEHALQVTGDTWVAHNNLANALRNQGKLPAAIHHYRLALKGHPLNPEGGYYNLAIALEDSGRHAQAVASYSRALALNPDFVAAHINLGVVLSRQGKADEARRHFERALSLEPDSIQAHINLGNVLSGQGRTEDAIRHYRRAVETNPALAEPHDLLGLALLRQGKIKKAILQFKRAVRENPADAALRRNLNLASFFDEQISGAARAWRQALEIGFEDRERPALEARVDDVLGKKMALYRIVARLQKFLSGQPGFVKEDLNAIPALVEARQAYDRALPVFMQIVFLRPQCAAAYYNIACIYARRGKIDAANAWLNQAQRKGFDRRQIIEADFDLDQLREAGDRKKLVKAR